MNPKVRNWNIFYLCFIINMGVHKVWNVIDIYQPQDLGKCSLRKSLYAIARGLINVWNEFYGGKDAGCEG